jgi:hypothetical protein
MKLLNEIVSIVLRFATYGDKKTLHSLRLVCKRYAFILDQFIEWRFILKTKWEVGLLLREPRIKAIKCSELDLHSFHIKYYQYENFKRFLSERKPIVNYFAFKSLGRFNKYDEEIMISLKNRIHTIGVGLYDLLLISNVVEKIGSIKYFIYEHQISSWFDATITILPAIVTETIEIRLKATISTLDLSRAKCDHLIIIPSDFIWNSEPFSIVLPEKVNSVKIIDNNTHTSSLVNIKELISTSLHNKVKSISLELHCIPESIEYFKSLIADIKAEVIWKMK